MKPLAACLMQRPEYRRYGDRVTPLSGEWNVHTRTITETRLEIQKLNQLPPLSMVANELLQVFSAGSMDVRRIAAVISRDPALLARLIGLANSAYFGYPKPVLTAEDAIFKVLGINIARSLAFSVSLTGPLQTGHCPVFRIEQYWANAMTAATLARELARLADKPSQLHPDNAYLAGLLHNLGLLALVHLYPAEMSWVLDRLAAEAPHLRLASLLVDVLGANHLQAGGWLARKWHLPGFIVTCIEHHRDDDYTGEYQQLVQLIGFSARWTSSLWSTRAAPEASELEGLGIDLPGAERVLEKMHGQQPDIAVLAHMLADG